MECPLPLSHTRQAKAVSAKYQRTSCAVSPRINQQSGCTHTQRGGKHQCNVLSMPLKNGCPKSTGNPESSFGLTTRNKYYGLIRISTYLNIYLPTSYLPTHPPTELIELAIYRSTNLSVYLSVCLPTCLSSSLSLSLSVHRSVYLSSEPFLGISVTSRG